MKFIKSAVNTVADYQKVVDNINANATDDDIVKIDFPVMSYPEIAIHKN